MFGVNIWVNNVHHLHVKGENQKNLEQAIKVYLRTIIDYAPGQFAMAHATIYKFPVGPVVYSRMQGKE